MLTLLTTARRRLKLLLLVLLCLPLLGRSAIVPGDRSERVRAFTRPIEFDFVSWTLEALAAKGAQSSLGVIDYMNASGQSQLVLDYLALVREIQQTEGRLNDVFADPTVADPEQASQELRVRLEALDAQSQRLGPLAEAALQAQLHSTLADLGLTLGGQPLPPVLYHTTSPPLALIVSPREVIRQDHNISISPGLTVDEREALEARVDQALNVSSLVVPIGGIGTYPTMVMRTSDINWLAEVVAHEWIHNYLTLRPLGMQIFTSPEMLTINETTASIAGKEIGRALVARYYPEYLPPEPTPTPAAPAPESTPEPPAFDFRAEMAKTRETVDQMLAEGKVEEAEAYMEARRKVFWEHGYRLRKINQAYFAFYGSYADQPGGAAGEDPVGAAVRTFRAQSPSLAAFLKRIAWVTSFEDLQSLLQAST